MNIENNPEKRATSISFKLPQPVEVKNDLFEYVLSGIAKNCKVGPFKATSGVVLPCK